MHTFNITCVHFWTDSTSVLAQLRTQCKLKPFFAVRMSEILDSSYGDQWHYVPTDQNPADYITKWRNDGWRQTTYGFWDRTFYDDPPRIGLASHKSMKVV